MYDKNLQVSRENMVHNQIITNQVKNETLINALLTIKKEEFIPESKIAQTYSDSEISFPNNRFLIKTFVLAKMIEFSKISENESVLVIGCLTGYSVAIISKLAGYVFGLENINDMVVGANKTLSDMACHNCTINFGKLSDGLKKNAPYDKILIEGGIQFIPKKIISQLKDGGKLFCILKEDKSVIGDFCEGIKIDGQVSFRYLFNANINLIEDFKNEYDTNQNNN